jgi:hypothetical protein
MTTKTVTIITSSQDEVSLASVAERFPLVTRHRLAQVIYRYGLRACAGRPEIVLEEARLTDATASES